MAKKQFLEDDEPNRESLTAGLQRSSGAGRWLTIVCLVLFLAATGVAGYFYKELHDTKKDPSKAAQDEVKSVVAEVEKLMVLPIGEEPTLATVTDPDKLKDQPFFTNAKQGYKVLIYTNAKKAILYNPTEHKIVEVAPINIGNNTQAGSAADSTAGASATTDAQGNATTGIIDKAVAVQVQNGAGVFGLARKVADSLKQLGFTQVTTSDASVGSHPKTIISHGKGYAESAASVRDALKSQATLEEQAGVVGVVVVLGTDFVTK